jgi:hypothetical protein
MTSRIRTLAAVASCAGLLGAATACSDYLKVVNPNSVNVSKLADSTNAGLLVNGAIGEFQGMIANTAMYGALFTDEASNGHVNVSYIQLDQRQVTSQLDLVSLTYSPIQRARFDGDTVANYIIGYEGKTAASTDPRVARMLALSGYSYIMLAETFCTAPIAGSAPYSTAELLKQAIPKLDSAVAIAKAASAAGISKASADSITNLALVARARAAVDLGDWQGAITYASQVPAGFEYRVYYSEGIPTTPGLPVNPFWNAMGSPQVTSAANGASANSGYTYSSGALFLAVDTTFQNLNDPRVPTTTTRVKAMNGAMVYVASKPKSFGGYVAPSASKPSGQPMTPGASIRIASYLEAQYIIAEANQGNAATLAFVNQQRAANGLLPSTATTPAAILADLRDQRRREFYLDGHRLGDLRRYVTQYSVDQFPTGTGFGTATCFPIPISEINSNPKVPSGT